uniref:Ice-binding protein isoform 2 n=1 Tax=Pyramimonas gelidicola TaxID=471943 RepID=I3UIH4_9CHLO|nr:ice-binding protein isoform 2 [Pyramimonas gelidicola]
MTFSSKTCYVLVILSLALGGASARALTTLSAGANANVGSGSACEPLTVESSLVEKVEIGSAGNYVMLTKTGISTVPDSAITGDMGVSPIAATAMTGFSLTADPTNKFSTSEQLTGKAFAANYATPTPAHLTTAVSDMETAYTDAAGRANEDPERLNLNGGALGGDFGGECAPLTPGVYTFGSDVTIGANIYFEGSTASGNTDVFIIQMTGNLMQVANTQVVLSGGALAKNIFWQISGAAEISEKAHMKGILLVKTDVLFKTESSLSGRVLAQTACNLQKATISDEAL